MSYPVAYRRASAVAQAFRSATAQVSRPAAEVIDFQAAKRYLRRPAVPASEFEDIRVPQSVLRRVPAVGQLRLALYALQLIEDERIRNWYSLQGTPTLKLTNWTVDRNCTGSNGPVFSTTFNFPTCGVPLTVASPSGPLPIYGPFLFGQGANGPNANISSMTFIGRNGLGQWLYQPNMRYLHGTPFAVAPLMRLRPEPGFVPVEVPWVLTPYRVNSEVWQAGYAEPESGSQAEPQPRARPRPALAPRFLQPPKKGDKERKGKVLSTAWHILRALNELTEFHDLVKAAFYSIPKNLRPKGIANDQIAMDKYMLAEGWKHVNLTEFVLRAIVTNIYDYIIGAPHAVASRKLRSMGFLWGSSTRLQQGGPFRLDVWHGVPKNEQPIFEAIRDGVNNLIEHAPGADGH